MKLGIVFLLLSSCVVLAQVNPPNPPGPPTPVTAGNVVGPASSVNGDCASFSGTTGKLIQDSGSACGGGSSTITAGATATAGFVSGDLIATAGNLATDSNIATTDVARLSTSQTFSGAKQFNSGITVLNGLNISKGVQDTSFNYLQPTTGFSITAGSGNWHTILDPAGTLATGTITMPTVFSNGNLITVRTTQTVTALTVAPNTSQTVIGAPTTLLAGTSVNCLFRQTNTTWYCSTGS